MAWTAIDAQWWFGGNRERGIGKYLQTFFSAHCHIPRSQRRWIIPPGKDISLAQELVQQFGGELIWIPEGKIDVSWVQSLVESGCSQVFFPSPFERPYSLIDWWPLFSRQQIRGEAILFDLLPLEYPKQILSSWSDEDQRQYQSRLASLTALDFLWCISPSTEKKLRQLLLLPAGKSKVLTFGLKDSWLSIPHEIPSPESEKNVKIIERDPFLVVTISGGEWRKNLEGTLAYFLETFPRPYRLVVICRLGRQRSWRLKASLFLKGAWNRVQFVGEVGEPEKWRWLERASAFLFLSRAEGLGIPLLEAKKAGIPDIYVSKNLIQEGLGSLVDSPIPVDLDV